MVIPREIRRITYSTEIRNLKKRLGLSPLQTEVLVGCLLGDAHLENNWSKTNYRLKISQSKQQESYVLWKYDIFKDWVLTKPKLHVSTNSMRFTTVSHSDLTNIGSMFYKDKKKTIPGNIQELLSPLALAVWFMDDGNAVRNSSQRLYGYHINSQSFSINENEILRRALEDRYGVKCTLQKNHEKYRLYIGKDHKESFRNIIDKLMLPSMRYKLG